MFGFNFDRKTMIIIITIITVAWLVNLATAGTAGIGVILSMVLSIPGVFIAMTFHEFAHAYAATKLRR